MGEAVFTEVEIPRFVAVERSAKNEPEKLQMLFERTGLEDFNLTILRSNSENFEKKLSDEELIRESSRVVVIKGGWCSDRKILEDLAADILERDPKAVVLMIDHAGQRDSGFKNPEIITTDEHKETLEFNLEATKVGMEFLGFSDEQILKLNKNLVKIGHSRGAAAGLYDKEALDNPDIKYLFLAPVLGHHGFNPDVARIILPLSIATARTIYRHANLLDFAADRVRNLLINYYVGSSHKKVVDRYIENFHHTDKIVLARFIANLYEQEFPDLIGKINPERHHFYVYGNDKFVDKDHMLNEIKKGIGEDKFEQCVSTYDGDHHAFLDSNTGSNKDI